MRLFKALFMLLMLVTFSTGFGKTTADLKQNSTTELVNGSSIVTVSPVNVVLTKTNILDVGFIRNYEDQKLVFNQKERSCQELDQSLCASLLPITKEAKPQNLEPFMVPLKKTRILQNLLRTEALKLLSLTMLPPMVYSYQEKITS